MHEVIGNKDIPNYLNLTIKELQPDDMSAKVQSAVSEAFTDNYIPMNKFKYLYDGETYYSTFFPGDLFILLVTLESAIVGFKISESLFLKQNEDLPEELRSRLFDLSSLKEELNMSMCVIISSLSDPEHILPHFPNSGYTIYNIFETTPRTKIHTSIIIDFADPGNREIIFG